MKINNNFIIIGKLLGISLSLLILFSYVEAPLPEGSGIYKTSSFNFAEGDKKLDIFSWFESHVFQLKRKKTSNITVWQNGKKVKGLNIATQESQTQSDYQDIVTQDIKISSPKTPVEKAQIKTKIPETKSSDVHLFYQDQEITHDYRYQTKLVDSNQDGTIDTVEWQKPDLQDDSFKIETRMANNSIQDSGANWRDYQTENGIERRIWQDNVNYYDQEIKEYKPVELNILPSDHPSEFDYVVEKNNYKTYFKKLPSPKSIQYEYKGAKISYWYDQPENITKKEGYASGNRFIYPDFHPNIDLSISVEPQTLLEEFITYEYQDIKKLVGYFQIDQSVQFEKNLDGSISFYQKDTKELLWIIPVPVMYEVNYSQKENPEKRINYGVHFEIQKINEKESIYRLTKIIDPEGQAWLKNADYPLVIDAASTTISPSKDAYTIAQPGYNDSNYGSATNLALCGYTGWWKDIYIQFDLSSFSPGDNITSATLNLYDYYTSANGPHSAAYIKYITSSWSESTIAWSNAPSADINTGYIYGGGCGVNCWSKTTITNAVAAHVSGSRTNYGWKIDASNDNGEERFRSRNYSGTTYDPYLSVTYTESNGTPCSSSGNCSSGNCVDGYCCNSSCTGTCRACDVAGKLGTCSYIPNNTDPDNECTANSWSSCDSACVRRGSDGYCDGSGSCDTNDATGNISSGYICTGSGIQTAVSSSNYCATDENCDAGDCSATKWYISCNGSGSCRSASDHTNSATQTIYASQGYTLTNACATNGTAICGYSSTDCTGKYLLERDIYRCNASHSCAYDVGDEVYYCPTPPNPSQTLIEGQAIEFISELNFEDLASCNSKYTKPLVGENIDHIAKIKIGTAKDNLSGTIRNCQFTMNLNYPNAANFSCYLEQDNVDGITLAENTTYYVQAVVNNGIGEVYSDIHAFLFKEIQDPWFQVIDGSVHTDANVGGIGNSITSLLPDSNYLFNSDNASLITVNTGGIDLGDKSPDNLSKLNNAIFAQAGDFNQTTLRGFNYFRKRLLNKYDEDNLWSNNLTKSCDQDYCAYLSSEAENANNNPKPLARTIVINNGIDFDTSKSYIFIHDGDLTINSNITVSNNSALLMVVSGNITIGEDVTELQGVYIADGDITIEDAEDLAENQFRGEGSFIAYGNINLERDLGDFNETLPPQVFTHRPDIYYKLREVDPILNYKKKWRELNP